jgi:hypothetical protein
VPLISDIVLYGAANMPEADGATTGGAIDFSKRIEFAGSNFDATTFDLVSSASGDTAVHLTYQGRDPNMALQSESLVANGHTKVAGTISLAQLLAGVTTGGSIAGIAVSAGTPATGDIALIAHTLAVTGHIMQTGAANATATTPALANLSAADGELAVPGMILRTTGGTGANQIRRVLQVNPGGLGGDYVALNRNWTAVPDNTTIYEMGLGFCFDLTGSNGGVPLAGSATQTLAITRLFIGATGNYGGAGAATFYEEVFVNNNSTTAALTNARVSMGGISPALPGAAGFNVALALALNDTSTIANRQTGPATGFTTYSAGGVNVPTPGNLPASLGAASAAGAQKIALQLVLPGGMSGYDGAPTLTVGGGPPPFQASAFVGLDFVVGMRPTQIPPIPGVPIADMNGNVTREWWRWFSSIQNAVSQQQQ